MLFSISWRNVWRSKLRSTVMLTAIALGITAGIFMTAFYKGMADQRIDKAIRTEISNIQIHDPGFRQNNDINLYIPDALKITQEINGESGVSGACSRIVISSMVASAESFAGVKISGVFPDEEKKVTNLYKKVTDGNYFSKDRKNSVLISEKLADKLKVKLGSKVVLTLQDIHNNIISGAFRIVGLFNTHDNIFDESNLFVRYSDLARLMNMPDGAAHEIAIATTSNDAVNSVQKELSVKYPKLEVLSWYDLSPELGYLTDAMDLYMYIFIVIILLALLFGLVNTMLMVVLERVKEIGMLMAVGMNRLRIFMMIVLETVFLSLSGGVIGIILGTLISNYFESHKIPLSLWASAYEDLGYDAFVYTSLDSKLVITITLLVLLTGLIGSLYPAYKALQNNPSEALRID